MSTLKHRVFGTGEIVNRERNIITVRFDNDGAKKNFSIPQSFMGDFFVEIDDELRSEVNAAIEAKRKAVEATRASAQAIQAKALDQATGSGRKRSVKTPANVKAGGAIEDDFEKFLVDSGYSVVTPSGLPSTVFAYVRSIYLVLDEEGITWQTLKTEISKLIPVYDEGGAKEHIGSKSNASVINALRRFEEFVNNSTP